MKQSKRFFSLLIYIVFTITELSCNNNQSTPSQAIINQLHLKRGNVITCSPTAAQFGLVNFDVTGNADVKKDFNLALELLHSFEYDESEKVFAKIIDESPACAMAFWGIAMCNFHALWTPPTEAELKKGAQAIDIAKSIQKKSAKESAYINALGLFYKDWNKTNHHTRCVDFENAMQKIHLAFPEDKEAAIFYALSLVAAADVKDKSYTKQKKAGAILASLYKTEPNHPGVIHYIIHTYDYPELAALALPAAERYADVAPSSAHALHMPSHIFTRLGLWDKNIQTNLRSVEAARCYAESSGNPGHWDEELHGLDYLVYAYLQKGENALAQKQIDYLNSFKTISPLNFKVAYALAAIPCRYVLENKNWKDAAKLESHSVKINWGDYPWQESIIHFTRLLGAVHTDNLQAAKLELDNLKNLHGKLQNQKDIYKATEVTVQINTGAAWIQYAEGDKTGAIKLMKLAADMEDSTGKHPVTPGEVLPARELLGDLFFQMKDYQNALKTYEDVLKKSPNRFNSLYGAGKCAEKMQDNVKAIYYYKQLAANTDSKNTGRKELIESLGFLTKY